ncbi:Bifunctional inhibitor/lipid-transfer protein/seed storage 2S albumin superfamily protein [Raphanus sativus]|uniref:14 kDa proline-rich protein DC2.15-like n=1 Tax=Raphanus sativus TaxID=3726 RepID=A0A6J0MNW9_RAPSA|nr:14 kDa proline-rich protein DC2.15-like [Raphanus sativus]KAJ4906053.1 Bifunctional inhibitor/lipid-transfer protein/seed storage 2S albumin superfamily protein [Raphanus sativus]
MASKTLAIVLLFNIICFTAVNATGCPNAVNLVTVCADLLNGVVKVSLPAGTECCTLLKGIVDANAAVCLCTAVKANIGSLLPLLNIPLAVSLTLNACGVPSGIPCL